ncbi:hypothetical protein AVEN_266342-1 [Araneus ventricosus]|uniref:Uncharacterized protein n=1 Tax=Araneus ventricosus TaxID=182803 RepID=A0A4Y2CPM8_ARAVE|nr:hypothetical protein AVEN_266342-1 [Araneus ventricosus]
MERTTPELVPTSPSFHTTPTGGVVTFRAAVPYQTLPLFFQKTTILSQDTVQSPAGSSPNRDRSQEDGQLGDGFQLAWKKRKEEIGQR